MFFGDHLHLSVLSIATLLLNGMTLSSLDLKPACHGWWPILRVCRDRTLCPLSPVEDAEKRKPAQM